MTDQELNTASLAKSDGGEPVAFVVPFYGDQEFSVRYLAEAIDGFDQQTDPHWRAIIVDDATPRDDARDYLSKIEAERNEQVHVIRLPKNMGHGYARTLPSSTPPPAATPSSCITMLMTFSHPERVKVVRAACLRGRRQFPLYAGHSEPISSHDFTLGFVSPSAKNGCGAVLQELGQSLVGRIRECPPGRGQSWTLV
jgi:hypothetical protein